jgi:dihydroneopterin aldolase
MAVRSKLIEHVTRRILEALKAEWPARYTWRVHLVKEHPPIPGTVEHVAYTLEG